ncbi:MAG TPA: TonB-dependent receptor, partial [Opitutaceae bacterium]|nr:TonB-dependent receptor [Opitutaceae bacterium]
YIMNAFNRSAACRHVLAIVAAIAAAGVGSAQSVTPKTEVDSETIELSPFVTTSETDNGYRSEKTLVGSRTSKSVMDLAGTVSIINQQQITDLNAVEVHDVLQFGVAGVTQNQTINDDVNIRGFRTTFSLRDGVTKTSYKRNPMFDVERIEVIKGPGAMLLGNNSFLGGGVNFVTRQPSHKRAHDLHFTVGADNYYRLQANTTGPLIDKEGFKVDYRLTVGLLTADKDKEIEEEDQKFIGGAVTAYLGSNVTVMLNAYYMADNGYFYWEDFLDYNTTLGTAAAPVAAKLNQYSTKEFSPGRSKDAFWDNQDSFVNLTMLTKLTENANLRLAYFYANLVDRRRIVRGITITADNRTLLRQDIPVKIDSWSQNLQADFTHKFTRSAFTLDSTLGADLNYSFTRQDQSVNTLPSLDTANPNLAADDAYFAVARPGAGLPNLTQDITRPQSLSYYFQENLSLLKDKVILIGGLRWFMPGGTNKNNVTGVVTDRPDKQLRTHKYGVVVKPIPAVSIYYTDSENVFPQSGRTDRFQGNDQLGAPLSDQNGTMEEYGVKVDYKFNEQLSAYGSVAYYDMSLTHVRTFGVLPEGNPPGSIGIIESAADMSKGWEFEYGMRYNTDGGEFNLIGTYTDGDSQIAADPNQMAVDFVPKKTSLMARYAWKTGPLDGFVFGATYFDQTKKRNANWWIDFPATYNVFARYSWGKNWSAQLNLNNITDERYIVAIAANGLVQTEPGFDAKLAVRYAW